MPSTGLVAGYILLKRQVRNAIHSVTFQEHFKLSQEQLTPRRPQQLVA